MGKFLINVIFAMIVVILGLLIILKIGNRSEIGFWPLLPSAAIQALAAVDTTANVKDIFISEINYAGSLKSDDCKLGETKFNCNSDKWIELWNPSTKIANLKEYSILVGPNQKKLPLSGSISPQSHFLIRNNNKTINSTISNNFQLELGFLQNISSKASQFINLQLLHNQQLIDDKTQSVSNFEPYQTNLERHTLEFSNSFSAPKLSEKIYFQDGDLINYGTPNFSFVEPAKTPQVLTAEEVQKIPVLASNSTNNFNPNKVLEGQGVQLEPHPSLNNPSLENNLNPASAHKVLNSETSPQNQPNSQVINQSKMIDLGNLSPASKNIKVEASANSAAEIVGPNPQKEVQQNIQKPALETSVATNPATSQSPQTQAANSAIKTLLSLIVCAWSYYLIGSAKHFLTKSDQCLIY